MCELQTIITGYFGRNPDTPPTSAKEMIEALLENVPSPKHVTLCIVCPSTSTVA